MMTVFCSVCGGNSQSYASGDWTSAVASPNAQLFSGTLPAGKEIVSFSAAEILLFTHRWAHTEYHD